MSTVDSEVYEFGFLIDLNDETSVTRYIIAYSNWLDDLVLPTNHANFIAWARKHLSGKRHRQVALTMLVPHMPKARALNLAYMGKLSEKRFEALMKAEAQSLEFIALIALTLAAGFIYIVLRQTQQVVTSFTNTSSALTSQMNSIGDQVAKSIEGVSKVTNPIGDMVSTVTDMFTKVWDWCQERIKSILALFKEKADCFFVKAVATTAVIYLGYTFIKTVFPSYYDSLKTALLAQFGLFEHPAQAQDGDDETEDYSILHEILDFFRSNFTSVTSAKFWQHMEKLPKIVSIAQAIKWIFEHFLDLYNVCYEMMTGKIVGRSKLERDILAFDVAVSELEKVQLLSVTTDKEAVSIPQTITSLELQEKALAAEVTKGKTTRPFVVNTFSKARETLKKIATKYLLQQTAAKKRPIPVWLYMYGDPGVGKSYCTETIIRNVYNEVRGMDQEIFPEPEFNNTMLYPWPQTETYFDGYTNQPFVLIDDLFQPVCPETRANVASTLITMVAPTPYSLLVANPTLKNHVHFTSKVIITSTNIKEGRNPQKPLDGNNLGIQDSSALSSRRTVVVKVCRDQGGPPYFICSNEIDGLVNVRLTMEELVALVASLVVARHREMHEPIPMLRCPPFTRSFKSERITLPAQAQSGDNEEKGAEEDDRKPCEERESSPDKGKIKETFISDSRELEDLRDNAGMLFEGDVSHEDYLYFKKHMPKITDGQSFDAVLTRFRHLEGTLRPEFMRERMLYKTNPTYSLVSDITYMRFFWSPPMFEHILNNPGLVLPQVFKQGATPLHYAMFALDAPLYADYVPHSDQVWWADNVLAHKKKIEGVWKCHEAADPLYWNKQIALHQSRVTMFNNFLMLVAQFTMVIVAIRALLGLIMPAAAYEPAQAQTYDGVAKAPSRPMTKRVARRQSARERQIKEPAIAQNGSQASLIFSNIEHITIEVNDKGQTVNDPMVGMKFAYALFIGGTTAIAPGHLVQQPYPGKEVYLALGRNGKNARATFHMNELIIEPFQGDLVLVHFPRIRMNARKNITSQFCDTVPSFGDVAVYTFSEEGQCLIVRATEWDNVIDSAVTTSGENFDTDITLQGIPNAKGMCGLPYIHMSTGRIIGFHAAGRPTVLQAQGIIVLKEDVADKVVTNTVDPIPLDNLEIASNIPGLVVLGKADAQASSFMPSVSNLRLTPLAYDKDFPFPETTDRPAMLAPEDGVRPLHVALNNFAKQEDIPDNHVPFDYSEFIPKTFRRSAIRRLTLEEAIYGIPGYIDSIDMSASVGYLWKKCGFKSRLELFFKDGQRCIHPLFRRDIEIRVAELNAGKCRPVVYECILKDEIRPLEKVNLGKTRLFDSGDLSSFIIARMAAATLYAELTSDPVNSPCGLGLNPHSDQWGQLYNKLRPDESYDPVFGDMGTYDISLKGPAEEDFVVMTDELTADDWIPLILQATREGIHIVCSVIFRRAWPTTASGSFWTSLINTFKNFRNKKVLFHYLYPDGDFKLVGKSFTGDDSAMGVPPQYAKYNMAYLQKAYWERWRMVYTSPDKSDRMTLTWSEVEYLKRKFVVGHAGIMAPLAPNSMANMVKWTEKYWDSEKAKSVMNSVLLECWHYGPETYNLALRWCNKECSRLGYSFILPSWSLMWANREGDYQFLAKCAH